MSQINTFCAKFENLDETAAYQFPTYTTKTTVTNTSRAPGPEHGIEGPLDVYRTITEQSSNNPDVSNAPDTPGCAGIIVTDCTTYTFNFSATPVVPVLADYVNANLLCEDLCKWGSQMERWAVAFQSFATEMDEIVKLPCTPHFIIDQHGFKITVKLPTGPRFEAEVQRALERGIARFVKCFEVRIASEGGVENGQYSMRTQQPAIQQPISQRSEFAQDQSQAPTHEESVAAGSPTLMKGGRGRGRGSSAAGRGGGGTIGKITKSKKNPTEKKTPAKKAPATRDPATKARARNTPLKNTTKAAAAKDPKPPSVSTKLVDSKDLGVLVPKAETDADIGSVDLIAELEATLASENI